MKVEWKEISKNTDLEEGEYWIWRTNIDRKKIIERALVRGCGARSFDNKHIYENLRATHYAPVERPDPPEEPVATLSFVEALRCVLDGGKARNLEWMSDKEPYLFLVMDILAVRDNKGNSEPWLSEREWETKQDMLSNSWIIIEEPPKKEFSSLLNSLIDILNLYDTTSIMSPEVVSLLRELKEKYKK